MRKFITKIRENYLKIIFTILSTIGVFSDLGLFSLGAFETIYTLLLLFLLILVLKPIETIYKRKDNFLYFLLFLYIIIIFSLIYHIGQGPLLFDALLLAAIFPIWLLSFKLIEIFCKIKGISLEEHLTEYIFALRSNIFSKQNILTSLKKIRSISRYWIFIYTLFIISPLVVISSSFVALLGLDRFINLMGFKVTKLILLVLPYIKDIAEKAYSRIKRKKIELYLPLDETFYIDIFKPNLHIKTSEIFVIIIGVFISFFLYLTIMEGFLLGFLDVISLYFSSLEFKSENIIFLLWSILFLFSEIGYVMIFLYYLGSLLKNKTKSKVTIRGDFQLILMFYISGIFTWIVWFITVKYPSFDEIIKYLMIIIFSVIVLAIFISFVRKKKLIDVEKLIIYFILISLRMPFFNSFLLILALLVGYISSDIILFTLITTVMLPVVFITLEYLSIFQKIHSISYIFAFMNLFIFMSLFAFINIILLIIGISWIVLFLFIVIKFEDAKKRVLRECLSGEYIEKEVIKLLLEKPRTERELINTLGVEKEEIERVLDYLSLIDVISSKIKAAEEKIFYIKKDSYRLLRKLIKI